MLERIKLIRHRLTAMSALTSSAALVLACASFLAYELFTFRKALVDDVGSDARLLAYDVAAPLLFNDPAAATSVLQALKAKSRVRSALVTSIDGAVFASYGTARSSAPLSAHFAGDSWQTFDADGLVLGVPVLSEGAPIGTLILESTLDEHDQRMRRYLLLGASILVVSMIIALGISSRLQRGIVRPIVQLTEAAARVSRDSDYSVRVAPQTGDELGTLATAFNDMISRVEQKDAGLRASEERYRLLFENSQRDAEALRRSEARFARLFSAGIIGIIVADLVGNILEANDAFLAIVGYTRDDLREGRVHWEKMTPAKWRPADEQAVAELRTRGVTRPFEKEYLHRSGSAVPIVIGATMLDEETCICFVLDVSERKRLEKVSRQAFELETQNRRMQEESRLKSEFLANMSHELRTPLNAILGFGELLHDGIVARDSPQAVEFLAAILKSGRHLLKLINDVLDLAKVEAGKLDFRPEPIELETLVYEVMSIARATVTKRIETSTEIDPELREGLFLDPSRFKQILYNFVSNAMKFTPSRGLVKVRARPHGKEWFIVEVEDTGPGIAPEDLPRLFVEFQQLEAGKAREHAGTGLGLALTRRLAEAQGGSVGVHSTPGKGSVFHVILPRRRPAGPEQPRIQRRAAAPGAPSVLVIEDEEHDQARLVEALSEAGYAVEAASTGAQALALCKVRKFDAITLDLLLGDMSGQDVLRQVRASEPNSDVPVVVVTVVPDKGVIAGFTVQDFLHKPLDGVALLASLARAGLKPEQPGSVLVVDDDPGSLRLMAALLERLGFSAVAMQDPEKALRAAESAPPAAVVLDLMMPGMDGFEFLDRLRAAPATHRTPVLVWSIKDLSEPERARLSRSAHAIVRKGHGGIAALLEELRRFFPASEAVVSLNSTQAGST